jgi:hypothetical protein
VLKPNHGAAERCHRDRNVVRDGVERHPVSKDVGKDSIDGENLLEMNSE